MQCEYHEQLTSTPHNGSRSSQIGTEADVVFSLCRARFRKRWLRNIAPDTYSAKGRWLESGLMQRSRWSWCVLTNQPSKERLWEPDGYLYQCSPSPQFEWNFSEIPTLRK